VNLWGVRKLFTKLSYVRRGVLGQAKMSQSRASSFRSLFRHSSYLNTRASLWIPVKIDRTFYPAKPVYHIRWEQSDARLQALHTATRLQPTLLLEDKTLVDLGL